MTTQPHDTASLAENDTLRNQFRLVAGLLIGPVVYSLYFLAVYLLVEAACREKLLRFTLGGMNGLVITVLGLTGVASAIILLGMYLCYGGPWSKIGAEQAPNQHWIRQIGLGLSGFFVMVTLETGLPILFLELCSWV